MEREPSQLYRFGTFVLNPAERSLFKDNDSVPLTPKAFDLLVVLAENSGHLLTKNELMSRLWPDAFVEEANLTQNISTLRKALGESHNIETVPKLGYRFNATVTRVPYIQERVVIEEHTKSRLVIETSDDVQSSARVLSRTAVLLLEKPKVLVAIGFGLLIVLVGGFGLRSDLNRQEGTRAGSSWGDLTIDAWRNEEGEPGDGGTFSHGGKKIASSKRRDGYQKIWIRQIVADQPLQITNGAWNDWTPIWSPDDEQIAFISDRDNRTAIWVAPSMSGGSASPN